MAAQQILARQIITPHNSYSFAPAV